MVIRLPFDCARPAASHCRPRAQFARRPCHTSNWLYQSFR